MSLEHDDAEAGSVAVAPRVTLNDLKAEVAFTVFANGVDQLATTEGVDQTVLGSLRCLTICTLITRSGFTVVGTSGCASPENYNRELGEKFALDDAMNKLWAFEGYVLRKQLAQSVEESSD